MQATDSLSSDHRLIERLCAVLSMAAARLDDGEPVRPALFLDAARFIRDFADGCHHRKEENVLFPALTAHGLPADGGPVAVMLWEHERGREFARGLRAAAERLASGDRSAAPDVVGNAIGYADLLRDHIAKEDHVLFPMAGRLIPPAEQDGVMEAFERIEKEQPDPEGHAAYHALVRALEAELEKVAAS